MCHRPLSPSANHMAPALHANISSLILLAIGNNKSFLISQLKASVDKQSTKTQ